MRRAHSALLLLAACGAPSPDAVPSATSPVPPEAATVPLALDGGGYGVTAFDGGIRVSGAPDLAAAARVYAAWCGLDPIRMAALGDLRAVTRAEPGGLVIARPCPSGART